MLVTVSFPGFLFENWALDMNTLSDYFHIVSTKLPMVFIYYYKLDLWPSEGKKHNYTRGEEWL